MNLKYYDILKNDAYLTSLWLTEEEAEIERDRGFIVRLSILRYWTI